MVPGSGTGAAFGAALNARKLKVSRSSFVPEAFVAALVKVARPEIVKSPTFLSKK